MMIKTFLKNIVTAAVFAGLSLCCTPAAIEFGQRADALDDSAWESSEWISVVDAPVVTGRIDEGSRAADGASWFLSTIRNDKKVSSAKWMTTGLGVYELYVNGQPIRSFATQGGLEGYAPPIDNRACSVKQKGTAISQSLFCFTE